MTKSKQNKLRHSDKIEISQKTWKKIMEGSNEELKSSLIFKDKRGFVGGETEDDKRIYKYKNTPQENLYKDANKATEYLLDPNEEENTLIEKIDNNIKQENAINEKDVRETLEKGKKYAGKIIDFDRYGNAIIIFENLEEEGLLRKGIKMGLKKNDEKQFTYVGKNKIKTKYLFSLSHHKNHKSNKNNIALELKNALETPRKKIKRKRRKDLTK